MVGAQLQYRIAMLRLQCEQRQRHTDLIVEVTPGSKCRRHFSQNRSGQLFDRALATTAGNGHQLTAETVTVQRRKPTQRQTGISDLTAGQIIGDRLFYQCRDCATRDGLIDKLDPDCYKDANPQNKKSYDKKRGETTPAPTNSKRQIFFPATKNTSPTTACKLPAYVNDLRLGTWGLAVKQVTAALKKLKYPVTPGTLYDVTAVAAVKRFQTDNKLPSTGTVNRTTLAALQKKCTATK